jgi:hypothetical protein
MEGEMNLGVLLLYCEEGRGTRFSRVWAERAVQRLAEYVFAQSGGRETITFKVYDWIQLPLTAAGWSALGFGAYASVRPYVEQMTGESLDPYDHILIGIDHPQSSGGTTPGTFTHLAAKNFTPSLMAHELGHRFGADDAFGEMTTGVERYLNRYCVMGGKGFPGTFTDESISDPDAPGLNRSGPAMSAPTLISTGWLDEDEHGTGLDLTSNILSSAGGRIEELSMLAGAPGPGWTRPPLVIRFQDLLIEYRVALPDGWDRGLPRLRGGAESWVVVHRSPRGAPAAVYVDSLPARPGASLVLGKDDPFDIFQPGPLRISVLSVNAVDNTVRLQFSKRAARPLPSGKTYGGVDVGGGGLIWTPGRGFTKVPPHSPLVNVLEEVAHIHALQEILAVAAKDEAAPLAEEVSRALGNLQQSVAALRVEPAISPLAHALQSITALQESGERLDPTVENLEMLREFVQTSIQRLAEVKRTLAQAMEAETQG